MVTNQTTNAPSVMNFITHMRTGPDKVIIKRQPDKPIAPPTQPNIAALCTWIGH